MILRCNMLDKNIKKAFIDALHEELVVAMGCTEPIALSYAAAKCRAVLGEMPESILARCSGNIIKNVRCVKIPNSGGMRGIESAVALGAIGGDADEYMEVLTSVTKEDAEAAKSFAADNCRVEFLDSEIPLHFIVEMKSGKNEASVEIRHAHTNIGI